MIVLRSDMLSAEADEWEGRSVLESLYAAGTSAELTAELERYSLSFAERLPFPDSIPSSGPENSLEPYFTSSCSRSLL